MLSEQAEAREFAAKTRIFDSKKILGQISDESTQEPTSRPHIKTFEGSHHSLESDMKVDMDTENRMNKFKEKNSHGHSSDSQMKDLLYNDQGVEKKTPLVEKIEEAEEVCDIESMDIEVIDVVETNIAPIKDETPESFEMMEVEAEEEEEAVFIEDSNFQKSLTGGVTSSPADLTNVVEDDKKMTPEKKKVGDETTQKLYRPSIRINPDKNSNLVSPLNEPRIKKIIKFNENLHHSKETSDSDLDLVKQNRIDMFKQINIHGHASDSQMHKLLFNNSGYNSKPAQFEIDEHQRLKNYNKFTEKDTRIENIEFSDVILPYETKFGFCSDIYKDLLTEEMKLNVKIKLNHMDNLSKIDVSIPVSK